jgi:hypothetical protein
MNKDIYIGIDPGKSGFICMYIADTQQFRFYEIPKIGKFIDVNGVNKIFRSIAILQDIHDLTVHCVTEDVHALFGASSGATFSFGYVVGLIEMAIVAHNIPYTKVQPKKWQAMMWAGIPVQKKLSSTGKTFVNDTKLMSKMAAKRLFPTIDLRRTEKCKNDDDNKIDALLLCSYAIRNF